MIHLSLGTLFLDKPMQTYKHIVYTCKYSTHIMYIYIHTYTHLYIYTYIIIYISLYTYIIIYIYHYIHISLYIYHYMIDLHTYVFSIVLNNVNPTDSQ